MLNEEEFEISFYDSFCENFIHEKCIDIFESSFISCKEPSNNDSGNKDNINDCSFESNSNYIMDILSIQNNDNDLKSKSLTEIIDNNSFLDDLNNHTINKSENAFSNNSKNSTESSSNCKNNICEHSAIYNNSVKFKVLKSLNIPEKFEEINIDLDISCHNLYYYKNKKNKIKEKIKKDYNIKTVKMEDYEKSLIREFKRLIKVNKDKYKDYLNEDEIFWQLFLSNKN